MKKASEVHQMAEASTALFRKQVLGEENIDRAIPGMYAIERALD